MSEVVISAHNISKRYRLGVYQRADTMAEQIKNALIYPIRNFRRISQLASFRDEVESSIFWALRDINFEVYRGEVLGIIGHNGAGKSTLLKILSRISEPTTGHIEIHGRVSALLEVGTGFHPELTGRDNIYMNGTILGMRRKEIDNKFDEIVSFSGVEKHIDTPVKFYSSGMTVRLAFSVAAHLEPEILIIDEVLAVGDAEFQKKCLGKMEDIAGSGRTVLFVSHNLEAIRRMCHRSILLNKGKVESNGKPDFVIEKYLKDSRFINPKISFATLTAEYTLIQRCKGVETVMIRPGEKYELVFSFKEEKLLDNINIGYSIKDSEGTCLLSFSNWYSRETLFDSAVRQGTIVSAVEDFPIYKPGVYYVDIYFGEHGTNHLVKNEIVSFEVIEYDYYGSGRVIDSRIAKYIHRQIHYETHEDLMLD